MIEDSHVYVMALLRTTGSVIRSVVLLLVFLASVYAGDQIAGVIDWHKIVKEAQGDAAIAHSKGLDDWKAIQGSFEIDTGMAGEPKAICRFAYPETKKNQKSPRFNDVVYYFHTPEPGDRNIINDELCSRLCSESGMVVFGISFLASSRYALFGDPREQEKFYAFGKSGSFRAVLIAWNKLRQQLKIDSDGFYVLGYSAGGIAAQRFAEECPNFCRGVVTVNGHTFVQRHKAYCPFLVIHTMGDLGESQGDGLDVYYRSIGTPCVRLVLSPSWSGMNSGNSGVFHGMNPSSGILAQRFIEGVSDLARKTPGVVPIPLANWPYITAAECPSVVTLSSRRNDWASTTLTPMPMPSALFYSQVLKSTPRRIEINTPGDEWLLATRPVITEPILGSIIVWHADAIGALGRDMEIIKHAIDIDQNYVAGRQYLAVSILRVGDFSNAVKAASITLGISGKGPLSAILFEPQSDVVVSLSKMQGLRKLIIIIKDSANITPILPDLQRCYASGVKIRILVSCSNKAQYEKLVSVVNPAVRDILFAPFYPKGNDADLSLHQQQLEAAVSFIGDEKGKQR